MELLKQPQYSPYPVEEQVVSIWTGTTGKLDNVPTEDVLRFEREFLDFMKRERGDVMDAIRETKNFDDDTDAALAKAYDAFLDQFQTSEGKSVRAGREEFEALPDEEVEQEQIVRQRRG